MLTSTFLALQLFVVQDMHTVEGATRITFTSGETLVLDPKQQDYDELVRMADQSRKYHSILGVKVSPDGQLQSMVRLEEGTPVRLVDQDPEFVKVLFRERDGVFRLRRDHPRYSAIRAILDEAILKGHRVYFSQRPPLLELEIVEPWRPSHTLAP